MGVLLDILSRKYSLDQFGMPSQLLTKEERLRVINAGVGKNKDG
jgi:hypothetical protein